MNKVSVNSKRIAKNTLMLYIRMFLAIIVGLYTSRVVLHTLGVSDYGIYNVVGGIVAMLAFLNSAMTTASQRFISFELGRNNLSRLKDVFCTSVTIHFTIAIIILLIAETVGLWFLNTHMNIAENRLTAANWVYQCSIFSFMLMIVSVPYNACIVAHEHMKAFAYISIMETILKLLIVYFLLVIHYDKLIIYALLVAGVSLFVRMVYGIYCKRNFEECKYHFSFYPGLFKEMFAFAGWSVVGNLGFSFKDQASNVVLNLFCGTAVNAARGVALQVNGIISNFSSNFVMALNPQITKQYAHGSIADSQKLVYAGCRFSFFLLSLIVVPVIINIDYLLQLWLGNVPQYTIQFLIGALVAALINSMATPLVTAMQATGDIKLFQIVICIIMICEPLLTYVVLHLGYPPYYAMIPTIGVTLIGLIARIFLLKRLISSYSIRYFIFHIMLRSIVVFSVSLGISFWIHQFFSTNFLNFFFTSFIALFITVVSIYWGGISREERVLLRQKIYSITRKNN